MTNGECILNYLQNIGYKPKGPVKLDGTIDFTFKVDDIGNIQILGTGLVIIDKNEREQK